MDGDKKCGGIVIGDRFIASAAHCIRTCPERCSRDWDKCANIPICFVKLRWISKKEEFHWNYKRLSENSYSARTGDLSITESFPEGEIECDVIGWISGKRRTMWETRRLFTRSRKSTTRVTQTSPSSSCRNRSTNALRTLRKTNVGQSKQSIFRRMTWRSNWTSMAERSVEISKSSHSE